MPAVRRLAEPRRVRVSLLQQQNLTRAIKELGNNLGTPAPEYQGKRGIRADQKAGRINKIDVQALSAKAPPPVQIRAAPPSAVSIGRPVGRSKGEVPGSTKVSPTLERAIRALGIARLNR